MDVPFKAPYNTILIHPIEILANPARFGLEAGRGAPTISKGAAKFMARGGQSAGMMPSPPSAATIAKLEAHLGGLRVDLARCQSAVASLEAELARGERSDFRIGLQAARNLEQEILRAIIVTTSAITGRAA